MPAKYIAFLAMPFRPELRWVREAIRQATIELAIQLRAVDENLAPGEEIVAGIRQQIRECALAYVVLSDLNPNVMWPERDRLRIEPSMGVYTMRSPSSLTRKQKSTSLDPTASSSSNPPTASASRAGRHLRCSHQSAG